MLIALLLALLAKTTVNAQSGDDNRLLNIVDAAGMFNERGYTQANSYSLSGREIINDFNGNLMYSQRLIYLPISQNGLHCDVKLAYNGNVSHVAFGARQGSNSIVQTPVNLPEWIISINGIAVQTFNFENELVTWQNDTSFSAHVSYDDEVAAHIEGYHKCYRERTSGVNHGIISILMEDGSVREFYSVSSGVSGPFFMFGGEYNSHSKDYSDRGYLWPLEHPHSGYFTLFRSDGTRVEFKIYQPHFRTRLDCEFSSLPSARTDYPRILLPVKFADQMGHEIDLSYAYKLGADTVLGRPVLTNAGAIQFSWSAWNTSTTTRDVIVSLDGSRISELSFANRPPDPGVIQGRGASWLGDFNRGLVWLIKDAADRSTTFKYRQYSRTYTDQNFNPSLLTIAICPSGQEKSGEIYRVEPWRIWRIQYPDGGESFMHYYRDPSTRSGYTMYNGLEDTLTIAYDHSETCQYGSNPPTFPCMKSSEFGAIGRDPFFLNIVAACRKYKTLEITDSTSLVSLDTLEFHWSDELDSLASIDIDDDFTTRRRLTVEFHPEVKSTFTSKDKTVKYRYYPESGPFSKSSRDRGWTLKTSFTSESGSFPSLSHVISKDFYWDTDCSTNVCKGTFQLDSLRTSYDHQTAWERYDYEWHGDPDLETTNNLRSKRAVDSWGISNEAFFDTSFMTIDGSSDDFYHTGLIDSVVTRRSWDNRRLRKEAYRYFATGAIHGYVGQLDRSAEYLIDASGTIIDSVVEMYRHLTADAPTIQHQGATKWLIDPLQDTVFNSYAAEGSVPVTNSLLTYDGTVETFPSQNRPIYSGPFWYKRTTRCGSQSLESHRSVDARGNIRWFVDPNGFRSEATYDVIDRVQTITLPGGFAPTLKSAMSSDTSWSIHYDYDDSPSPDPVNVRKSIRVDKAHPSQVSQVWFDGLSRPFRHESIGAFGDIDSTITTFDFAGRVVTLEDQLGNETTTDYDHLDRPIRVVYPAPVYERDSTYYYVTNAANIGLTSRFGFRDSTIFAEKHFDENNSRTDEFFDIRNKLRLSIKQSSSGPCSTFFDYDDLGNLSKVIRPNGDSVLYEYNSLGQLVEETNVDLSSLSGATFYQKRQFEYDKNGNVIRIKLPNGSLNSPAWAIYNKYDALNRQTESGIDVYGYGYQLLLPYRRFFYDQSSSEFSLGRLSLSVEFGSSGSPGYAERFDYDPRGRIKRQVNYFNATLDSSLSPQNYFVHGDSIVLLYSYDWADQLKSITYPDGSIIRYSYDSRGRLTAVGGSTDADSAKYARLKHTRRDELERMTIGSAVQQVDYLYNQRGWLKSINGGTSSAAGAPNDVFGQSLHYENFTDPNPPSSMTPQFNGNVAAQRQSLLGQDTTTCYTYDASDRLQESYRGSLGLESFGYDRNGNVTYRRHHSGPPAGRTFHYSPGTNRLSRIQTNQSLFLDDTLRYDANGNVVRHSGKKADFTYDPFDRLSWCTKPTILGRDTVSYDYSTSGERVYKDYRYQYRAPCNWPKSADSIGGEIEPHLGPGGDTTSLLCTFSGVSRTYYVLGQGRILAELSAPIAQAIKAKFLYAGGNRLALRDANNNLFFYLNDHLGSTVAVLDSTGTLRDKHWYYAFGQTRHEQTSTNQAYKYTSKPLDREAGLNIYYYGARYYDPDIGRFLSLDPLASKYPSVSPYAYVSNNPLRRIDPDGRTLWDIVDVGFAIWSIADAIEEPSAKNIVLAVVDVLAIAPIAPSTGWFRRGADAAGGAGRALGLTDNAADAAKATRVTGEELKKLRSEFETVAKPKYWKSEAEKNPTRYTPENLERMRQGKAPLGPDGRPIELHHKKPLSEGGTNDFDNLEPMQRSDHREGDNYRKNHPK